MADTMKAARLHAIGEFRVDEVSVPALSGEELLVRVGACGVCGSDIPRIFEFGTSRQRYPLTLGHEFSGVIAAAAGSSGRALVGRRGAFFPLIPCRGCGPCQVGRYTMCTDYDYLGSRSDGGFAEYCKVPSPWHFVESKNPGISLETLAMAEPASVAQHAVRKSGLTAGQTAVVFGAGPIGIMAARWARIFGASAVVLADIAEAKLQFARERGFPAVNAAAPDLLQQVLAVTGSPPDVAIEGTGAGAALSGCIQCVKPMGTVTLLGNPAGDTTISADSHSLLLRKELTLTSVWNSCYADAPFHEWRFTIAMMDEEKFIVDDLISHRVTLDGLPQLCRDIRGRRVSVCKAIYSAAAGQKEEIC